MKIVILDALTFGDADLSVFKSLGEVEIYETTSPKETSSRITNATVIVTNKVVIGDELMSCAPSLKLICIAATGMNNIDLDAAKKRGIEVKNVAGYSTDSVVQHTFSMLFYLLGSSRYYDEFVKDASYVKSPVFTHLSKPFFELKGKKWGIVGLGSIGRGVATIASAFGAKVCYHSTSGKNLTRDYMQVDLQTLLKTCDVISIHAPLNEQTKGLLSDKELRECKNGAIILNLGRGGIIDEEAVAKIVDQKELYFGLDVLESEPMRQDHPFLSVKNKERLYVTPHIAWASNEARKKLIELVAKNITDSTL
ncbi:MAG: D-2-hydroxyacid dehydrogenase [Sulfurimonas sp.]|uniref:D-2-hydroxyacid dehydrogenase n=1 Tax=Sulfurimonas sp. TaxID=2022749 RepID=UPI0025E9A133|nr:D-2-hydroxyacid dehydrogenase [Sulfurimonas sp.]MCK9491583.1 D-2-hydroxyacid dehydrogenase [Sulfurimonas sp.]